MIGLHDIFTYLQLVNSYSRPFTRLRRTQCKPIGEQYKVGVRFFDIRVVRHRVLWYFAHGFIRLRGMEFALVKLTGLVTKANRYKTSLKEGAKKINGKLDFFNDKVRLSKMKENKDELYLLDYCTNEYT